MTEHGTLPWSMAAIELAYLHRHDRVLVAGAARVGVVDAIAHQVGARGTVLVVEPDRSLAEQIADRGMPQVEVLAMAPVGERFGAFDALLCCPWTMPPWPSESFCDIALLNLRPGGRFVLDLPGPEMLPDLAACWPDCGGAEDGLRLFRGPGEDLLAEQARTAGLRRVQTAMGTHLWPLTSPLELLELVAPTLELTENRRTDLGLLLARRLRGTGAVDVLVHRSRIQAIR